MSYWQRLRLKTRPSADPEGRHAQTISLYGPFVITAAVLGLYFLVYWNWITLPTALVLDTATQNPHRFVAGVAKDHLEVLTRNGPRVVGSHNNEVFTVNFLRATIDEIVKNAHSIHKFEIEIQQQDGAMLYNFSNFRMTNVYQGIQNVLVKLTPANAPEPENYLMLSSHFDTVSQSPGAGDDGTMTVVMLETLRQLSLDSSAYQHGIVFVFNGCEESGLIGAHAFMKYHRWWQKVRTFINLDAASSGGREIMFQAGPKYSFLIKYYRDYVPHPFCTVMAEELFQANLIPSNTDYAVYTKIGGRPGLDFAHATWGYLYHTEYDAIDTVPTETLQHTGDNILALTRALANAPELVDINAHEGTKAVFFDFLNWFLVYYPDWAGTVINSVMAALALGLLGGSLWIISKETGVSYRRTGCQCLISFGVQLLSIIVGAGITILISVILEAAGYAMFWFSETWLIFGIYMCPILICTVLGPVLLIRFYKIRYILLKTRVVLFVFGQQLIMTVTLIALTALGIRSAYIVLITVIFFNISTIVNMILRYKKWPWIYVHLLGQIIPIAYYSYFSLIVFSIFIPMQGRGNPQSNPEIMIIGLSAVVILLICSLITPMLAMTRQPFIYIGFLVTFWVISIIVLLTPVGFPYRAKTSPQRHSVSHTEQRFYDLDGRLNKSDSLFQMVPQDAHSLRVIADTFPQMQPATLRDCEREFFCGYLWAPADQPTIPTEVKFQFLGKEQVTRNTTKFNFSMQGADHVTIYISPTSSSKLSAWSFSDQVTGVGRNLHYIRYLQGNDDSSYPFWVTIEHAVDKPATEMNFYMNILVEYEYHEQYRTKEFQQLIDSFPDYVFVKAFIRYLESWVF